MRITLLGTGSADGWPNPFCRCPSCESERGDRRTRSPSCALVDDAILVDCGPTAPHAIGAAGGSLARVEHVLITHGHPDHLHPAFLLSRSWVRTDHVLHVWAPPRALDLCRPWIGPDDAVDLHAIAPGDDVALSTDAGTYRARVIEARHAHGDGDILAQEAVLFEIADPDGDVLLYATDTAPLPATAVSRISAGLAAVLVDETFGDERDHGTGHLDLATLPAFLDDLKAVGAITPVTVVTATHLSHHNPPTAELRTRLAALGVQVLDDLSVIDTSLPGGLDRRRRLLIGGARSGKSTLAEQFAAESDEVTYVATGGSRADDPEWTRRVAAHQARRPATWTTVETIDVARAITDARPGTTLLVDCLGLWLTGQLDAIDAWPRLEDGEVEVLMSAIGTRIDDLVRAVESSRCDLVLVTNEVGLGVVPATASGRLFRDLLGTVNARIANACDETGLVVAGRVLLLDPRHPSSRRAHA